MYQTRDLDDARRELRERGGALLDMGADLGGNHLYQVMEADDALDLRGVPYHDPSQTSTQHPYFVAMDANGWDETQIANVAALLDEADMPPTR